MINKLFCNCPLLSLLGSLLIGHTTYNLIINEFMMFIVTGTIPDLPYQYNKGLCIKIKCHILDYLLS